ILEQDHFKIALKDSGFIPRFIDFLLQYDGLKMDNDWGKILYHEVVNHYQSKIADKPGHWRNKDDIRTIISFGITRQPVTREFLLPSGQSIGDIERDGMLYLSRVQCKPARDEFFIVLPFVMMKALNELLLTTSAGPVVPDHLLLIPTKDRP